MNSQIGIANGLDFSVQCETFESKTNQIIITGIEKDIIEDIKNETLIIKTFLSNIKNTYNLSIHFHFQSTNSIQYYNYGFPMLMALVSTIAKTPISDKYFFIGCLDLKGNLNFNHKIDKSNLKSISNKNAKIYLPTLNFEYYEKVTNLVFVNNVTHIVEHLFKNQNVSYFDDDGWADICKNFL